MHAPESKHILVGDDSPAVLDLLRDILEADGHRVTAWPDPLDLATIKRIGPDAIILDHMIEDGAGSGWRLMEQIRADADLAALPIVVCTGAVRRVRRQRPLLERLGAAVVLKPFDIDNLLTVVNRPWRNAVPRSSDLELAAAAG